MGECENIMLKKGNDYTATGDRLSNFKVAGAAAGLTPEQNCLSLIATKVARLGSLLAQNRVPDNEPIQDSMLDLINYGILLHMLYVERLNATDAAAICPDAHYPQPKTSRPMKAHAGH